MEKGKDERAALMKREALALWWLAQLGANCIMSCLRIGHQVHGNWRPNEIVPLLKATNNSLAGSGPA